MVVIRLTRKNCSKNLTYNIVVQDSRSPLSGRFIEKIGHFDTRIENSLKVNRERLEYWLKSGAQISNRVKKLTKS